jgi:sec-independent protein translocase protein TatC
MATQNKESEMTFLEHLEELRWHIIKSVVAVVLFAILAFVFKDIIFDVILFGPKSPNFFTNRLLCELAVKLNTPTLCINTTPLKLTNLTMSGQFSTHIYISIIAGLVAASPVIFYQFWSFVAPALRSNERRNSRGAVLVVTLLFLTGVLFGYYLISPLSINFLATYSISSEVENMINVSSYFSTVASIVLASGLVFELPVVAYFLSKIGIMTPSFMRKYRKHAIIVILIIAAIITPPDVFSQIMVTIPLIVLYEISIGISARVEKQRKKNAL